MRERERDSSFVGVFRAKVRTSTHPAHHALWMIFGQEKKQQFSFFSCHHHHPSSSSIIHHPIA